MTEMYMLEWSENQQCYHIGKVPELLKINVRGRLEHRPLDFIPLMISSDITRLEELAAALDEKSPRNRRTNNYTPRRGNHD